MRIITGLAKGVKLKTLKGLDVRPTGDRVKESIFNILENFKINNYLNIDEKNNQHEDENKNKHIHAIYQAKVLDLFAGTGNLGLEALSRGAKCAVFVDKNPVSVSVVMKNIQLMKVEPRCEVIKSDAFLVLDKMKRAGRAFNLIFIDPPYNQGLAERAADEFDNNNNVLLDPGGIVLVEHSKNEIIDCAWKRLTLIRSERYGQTVVSLLINNKEYKHIDI